MVSGLSLRLYFIKVTCPLSVRSDDALVEFGTSLDLIVLDWGLQPRLQRKCVALASLS